jgi:hypothetical protein
MTPNYKRIINSTDDIHATSEYVSIHDNKELGERKIQGGDILT